MPNKTKALRQNHTVIEAGIRIPTYTNLYMCTYDRVNDEAFLHICVVKRQGKINKN